MKKVIIFSGLILLFLFLTSCAHKAITIPPQCRHTSVFYALAVGERYPVRIVYGELWEGQHAEAQAYIDGEWQKLIFNGKEVAAVKEKTPWIIIYDDDVSMERAIKWSTKRFKTIKPGEKGE